MGHTYSNLLVPVIFSTKDRAPIIRDEFRERMHEYLAGVAREEFGRALNIGGTPDHLHALLSLKTDVAVAEAMRKWKSLSSGWIHETFPGNDVFAWQAGYGAFSVSQSNVPEVAAYIERQGEHHRKMTFQEEFVAFLKRHQVEYDPAHVWD
jgi:REP element-mobilizing transposase RayT